MKNEKRLKIGSFSGKKKTHRPRRQMTTNGVVARPSSEQKSLEHLNFEIDANGKHEIDDGIRSFEFVYVPRENDRRGWRDGGGGGGGVVVVNTKRKTKQKFKSTLICQKMKNDNRTEKQRFN